MSCRHHLFLDVTSKGNLKLNFPDLEPDELGVSCSLDMAEHPNNMEVVGAVMNITRERARQLELMALEKLAADGRLRELGDAQDGES